MTHERPARPRRSVADRATPARQVLGIGSWKIPVTVVAWGLSAILHGGLLTTSYFVTWSPAPASNPKVSFARGDQATRIQVLLVPWPAPAEEEETKQKPQQDAPAAGSSAIAVNVQQEAVVPLPEDVASESHLDQLVAVSEDRNPLAEKEAEATDVAEVRVLEDVGVVPPAEDTVEAVTRTRAVAEILDYLFDRLERLIAANETNERADRQQPLVKASIDEPVTPLAEESVKSNASSSQTAGVETGVEMLDLPTPKYPPLSRRRGEEGLVLLQVEVLPDGSVGDVRVLHDAGFVRLTEAAITAARKGRFKPATRNGQPVRAVVRIPFRFVLR